MWSLLVGWFLALIVYAESNDKIPYIRGTICNFEAYYNAKNKLAVNMFFCVPDSLCRKGVHRFPLMNYDGCNSFMHSSDADNLVCCHYQEIHEDLAGHLVTLTYLPGLKSFLMCKDLSHAICGPHGSYCADDATEAQEFRGLPTAISRYPHTALVGYYDASKPEWRWICLGSIVSKTYILTLWSCTSEGDKPATNVKLGESRHCHLDYCPDYEEEQNLNIISKLRQNPSNDGPHDLALLEVDAISFNKKVRPACLFDQLYTRQSQGWFARYSKLNETLVKTRPNRVPFFMEQDYKNVIAFKVKSAGEARIMFSRTGLPYRKEFFIEVVLGTADNQESMITRSDTWNLKRPFTPTNITYHILNGDQLRGFWIRVLPHEIRVGKEDSEDWNTFLQYDDDATDFHLPAMGISTPDSNGEWILHDYRVSASLHEFELELTYTDDCKEDLGDATAEEVKKIADTSTFCAKGGRSGVEGNKFRPCNNCGVFGRRNIIAASTLRWVEPQITTMVMSHRTAVRGIMLFTRYNDWGGAVQIMDERLFCMWQIFGVFMQDSPRNCSMVEKPALFKSLNRPSVLNWIEETIFPNFSILNLKLERPKCVGPHPVLVEAVPQ